MAIRLAAPMEIEEVGRIALRNARLNYCGRRSIRGFSSRDYLHAELLGRHAVEFELNETRVLEEALPDFTRRQVLAVSADVRRQCGEYHLHHVERPVVEAVELSLIHI